MFSDLFGRACGHEPYDYQSRIAESGLPDLLRVPTGAGKTAAAVLPWIYRRLQHPTRQVRSATPPKLVVILPQRGLVEQTRDVVSRWIDRLDMAADLPVHTLMGGASTDEREWQLSPELPGIFVGTQDMVLSRLLLRGYAAGRATWPISFGLLNSGAQFVVDETQLMGPGLPTTLQLQGLREALGTAAPTSTMWMSATVEPEDLRTVDFRGPAAVVQLTDADRVGPLAKRLSATRTVHRVESSDDVHEHVQRVAQELVRAHKPGSRTIAVLNTVERARSVYHALGRSAPAAEVLLLHSRFRPVERQAQLANALAEPSAAGTIVVTTQVLEAGVDVTSCTLFTEGAPWSSIVQRAGRCNRAGEHGDDATLLWARVPRTGNKTPPYGPDDVAASERALSELEGQRVTSIDLQEHAVPQSRQQHSVIRRRDLLDLFDTAPDLSGNDIDISRWVRDADETSVHVAFREAAEQPGQDTPRLARDELCAAPIHDVAKLVKDKTRAAWIFDQLDGIWRPAMPGDIRPGGMVLLDAQAGGYLLDEGWSPSSRQPVQPVPVESDPPDGVPDDQLSQRQGRWVTVEEHLEDVARETRALLRALGGPPGVLPDHRDAAVTAGALHDIGKVHQVFQSTMQACAEQDAPSNAGPWAKSAGGVARHARRYFRHELVSALMLLHPESPLLKEEAEPHLITYLVAAHHGKVRMTVRPMDEERKDGAVLGVRSGDQVPEVRLASGTEVPSLRLDLDLFIPGETTAGGSWTLWTRRLRDRQDLGPFRLAFLEAVVRMADWRVSRGYDEEPA